MIHFVQKKRERKVIHRPKKNELVSDFPSELVSRVILGLVSDMKIEP